MFWAIVLPTFKVQVMGILRGRLEHPIKCRRSRFVMRYLALAGSGGSEAALSVVERQAHPMFEFKAQYPPPNDPRILQVSFGEVVRGRRGKVGQLAFRYLRSRPGIAESRLFLRFRDARCTSTSQSA